MADPPDQPSYSLTDIQVMVRNGDYVVTDAAFRGASILRLERHDVEACILALDCTDFYKTMASTANPGLMQDVYKPTYLGVRLYVKVQISLQRSLHTKAVVISFKGDTSR